MVCPIPGCIENVTAQPTNEEKPLYPTSVYAINKRDQEEMFMAVGQAYGIPAVALRYFNTYGTRQALSNPYTGVAAIFSSRLFRLKTFFTPSSSSICYPRGLPLAAALFFACFRTLFIP